MTCENFYLTDWAGLPFGWSVLHWQHYFYLPQGHSRACWHF